METKIAQTPEELQQVMAIREEVFVREQQVPPELEKDAEDDSAIHFLALVNGQAVGAARLVVHGDEGKVGRMSVLSPFRGRGIGSALLQKVEAAAREQGLVRLRLHAQDHALKFYQRLGYQVTGEAFLEAGIVHFPVEKLLQGRD